MASLPCHFVELIMDCISSVPFSILWNGEPMVSFTLSRSLCQKDPLSSYIFTMCMERLPLLIKDAIKCDDWILIKLNRYTPYISHILFVDNLVLFGDCSIKQIKVIKEVLDKFCAASGSKISVWKTKILFSKNMSAKMVNVVSRVSGFDQVSDLGKYLGVLLI